MATGQQQGQTCASERASESALRAFSAASWNSSMNATMFGWLRRFRIETSRAEVLRTSSASGPEILNCFRATVAPLRMSVHLRTTP